MLQAICHSKAGRVATADTSCPDAETISWRKLFRTREDLLTAMFFGRLAYLSDKTLSHVMALLLNAEAADELLAGHRLLAVAQAKEWPEGGARRADAL